MRNSFLMLKDKQAPIVLNATAQNLALLFFVLLWQREAA